MQAGKLRHRGQIHVSTISEDDYGQAHEVFSLAATRWMSIEPLTGNELVKAQQVDATINVRIRMRHYAGLKPSDKIVFNGRDFFIVWVAGLEERGVEMLLMCREST